MIPVRISPLCVSVRRAFLAAALLPLGLYGQAALTVTNAPGTSSVDALALANLIKGSGIQSFANVTMTAKIGTGTTKNGGSSSAGSFSGGDTLLGIPSGLILSSGGVYNVLGPNSSGSIGQQNATGSDADLATLINVAASTVKDKTVLEFDFVPTYPTIAFRYVFSSDEYNEYANSQYNDVFGFFLNGTAAVNNIALIPGTNQPVAINTVNGGNPLGTNAKNPQYFRNNSPGVINVEMDGLTVVLTAQAPVNPGQTNHIKIAIADVFDQIYDSNVFIEQSSFVSGNAPVAANDGYKTPNNTALVVADSGVLANDTDLDKDLDHAQLITPPQHGTLSLSPLGGFTYTPATGYSGPDTFTYQAVDATHIQSNVATVTITVGASNSAPTGDTSTVSIAKNSVSPLPLSGFIFHDADAGNALTYISVQSISMPAGSSLTVNNVDVAPSQSIQALTIGNAELKFAPAPGEFGPAYATITYQVSDGVSLSAPQSLIIDVLNVAPEIAVSGNNALIQLGYPSPTSADFTDFGSVKTSNGTINRTFKVSNLGNAPLTVEHVTVTGPNANDFDVTIQPASSVAASTFTTFSVQFDPSANGVRTAVLNFNNSDGDESPFTFTIQGTGLASAPVVTSVSPAYGAVGGGTSVIITGENFLGASSVKIGGTAATSFVVNSDTQITATTAAHVLGTVDVVVINASGTGTGVGLFTYSTPDIAVEQPVNTNLVDNSATINFGSRGVGSPSAGTLFTIKNTGTAALDVGSITVNGTNAADFVVTPPAVTNVVAGATTTFTVVFTPGGDGARQANLHIASNDPDENPFDITLTGSGVPAVTIGAAAYTVNEEGGTITIPIQRTGNPAGAVSVPVTTVNGSAKAPADFTAVNTTVDFLSGETTKNVTITIIADAINTELDEVFTLQLGTPTGGVSLGANPSAQVTISEADSTIPLVAITTPAYGSKVPEGFVTVEGTARDNKGVERVEYSLNGGPFVEAHLVIPDTGTSTGQIATWDAVITATAGANTLVARSYDHRGNVSLLATRTFTYYVLRPLTVTVAPVDGGTVTITPALVGGQAELGVTYTLKATAKTGYLWHNWTAPGVTGAAAEASTLDVVMTDGLTVTASFVPNLFKVGGYNGLASTATGTTPSIANFGFFTGALTSAGSFSGKVNFRGTFQNFTAAFDPVTGNATGSTSFLSYQLHLDLSGGTDKITGTVTQVASGDVSNVDADLAPFNSTNKIAAQFLKDGDSTKNGIYNVVFPALLTQSGLTASDYPQGDGVGVVTVTPTGVASIAGTLADGTVVAASAPLSKDYRWPMAIFVKGTSLIAETVAGGSVVFDTTQTDSDCACLDVRWFRAAKSDEPYYPAGWSGGIGTFLTGAKYNVTTGSSVLPGLASASPSGNALLELSDGLLTATISKNLNISTANAVTKIPTTDTSYTLTITASSGALSGNFLHTGSATIKPVIKGTILQKGANAGGYGFFLSPVPAGSSTPGESGGVTLTAK